MREESARESVCVRHREQRLQPRPAGRDDDRRRFYSVRGAAYPIARPHVGKQAGPEDVVAPLVDVGDAPDRLEGVVRRVKVVLDDPVHHVLIEVVLLLDAEGVGERLEDDDEAEIEARLQRERVEDLEDFVEDAEYATHGRLLGLLRLGGGS